ncbi:oxidoreductase [Amycolatopsis acidiphila]|uniref:SDR family NAD(P)-dependent oxidoreductase n=1 Tax=Amycolatopsis acidiphila TaxID=715473 RepID=A0A558AK77_9PSEU|nr:oxidoreductase [Amycolatopsis acidiphila]TVT24601.1 SDR family NAD(P)-dependent oxidoreductase [Amycolatopsis acidiphila]UIJ58549.1 oxidoreductase [Amycolatopsis acidiphila]GHG76907.1 short-chain dehydrogenase [Amycolatopsis acidiphila]
MSPQLWTADDVPSQHGRVAVVTGANTGLGFQVASVLARSGAEVVLACRDPTKAAAAAERIRAATPDATVTTLQVDLTSQESVRRAAGQLAYDRIDLLVNNAGGFRAHRELTEDGFESTFAANHLGPFALTGLLLGRLLRAENSRVVTVSSVAHRRGRIDFDDLQSEHEFRSGKVYAQSKLANLMFSYALQRRLAVAGASTVAVAAHPGNARTGLGRELNPFARFLLGPHAKALTSWFLQQPEIAALAMVRAATDPEARGRDLYGPSGPWQFTGHPVRVEPDARAHDTDAQERLWQASERLTGVTYQFTRTANRCDCTHRTEMS